MNLPEELDVENYKVLKLIKPLYGLEHLGRCWNATIDGFITSLDINKLKLASCIHYKSDKKGRVIMLVLYADGVLFAFHEDEELQNVTTKLEEKNRKFFVLRCTKQRIVFTVTITHVERHAAYSQSRARENCCDTHGFKY